MHNQNRLPGVQRSCPDNRVPTIAAELLVVVVFVDDSEAFALEDPIGMQPIPFDSVRIEKPRDVERKLFTRNHTAHHALRLEIEPLVQQFVGHDIVAAVHISMRLFRLIRRRPFKRRVAEIQKQSSHNYSLIILERPNPSVRKGAHPTALIDKQQLADSADSRHSSSFHLTGRQG